MIFTCVGTGCFEKLVREVDRLKNIGVIKDGIIIQIGDGTYIPKHCEYFRYTKSLKEYYNKADLIITHGGPGSVFELLDIGKRFIAIANRARTDTMHQVDFLEAIHKEAHESFIYCRAIRDVGKAVLAAKKFKFVKYKRPKHFIDKVIIEKSKDF